ncbi:MAG: hypothetical protein JXB08_00735 [Bacilli bacterium]|nr:hypothetical protein [Bacilli bacterium]MBN2877603.1 hypothetical protein [Bacilli bacterium]
MKSLRKVLMLVLLGLFSLVFVACVNETTTTAQTTTTTTMETTTTEDHMVVELLKLKDMLPLHHDFECNGDVCTFFGSSSSGGIKLTFDFSLFTFMVEWYDKYEIDSQDVFAATGSVLIYLLNQDIFFFQSYEGVGTMESDYCFGNYHNQVWDGFEQSCTSISLVGLYNDVLDDYLEYLLNDVDLTVSDFK